MATNAELEQRVKVLEDEKRALQGAVSKLANQVVDASTGLGKLSQDMLVLTKVVEKLQGSVNNPQVKTYEATVNRY